MFSVCLSVQRVRKGYPMASGPRSLPRYLVAGPFQLDGRGYPRSLVPGPFLGRGEEISQSGVPLPAPTEPGTGLLTGLVTGREVPSPPDSTHHGRGRYASCSLAGELSCFNFSSRHDYKLLLVAGPGVAMVHVVLRN